VAFFAEKQDQELWSFYEGRGAEAAPGVPKGGRKLSRAGGPLREEIRIVATGKVEMKDLSGRNPRNTAPVPAQRRIQEIAQVNVIQGRG